MSGETPVPIGGIAYVRLSAPDLGRMEAFLEDFGMVKVQRDAKRLYMRGVGPAPFIHVTELGQPGVIGFAYDLLDEAPLDDVAKRPGASGIEHLDSPGGGKRVRLQDPNGLWVELVAGREAVQPLPARPLIRPPDGHSLAKRARVAGIVHTAYRVPNVMATVAWYRGLLDLLPSDAFWMETPDNITSMFMRVNAGDAPVNHHTLYISRGPKPALHHASFEMENVDDIYTGHDCLKARGYEHVYGVGRHPLGSQVFSYWMSPFETMHEHWYTTEKLNATSAFNTMRVGTGSENEKPPERFTKHLTPLVGWPDRNANP